MIKEPPNRVRAEKLQSYRALLPKSRFSGVSVGAPFFPSSVNEETCGFPWVGLKTEDIGANVRKATIHHPYLDGLYPLVN